MTEPNYHLSIEHRVDASEPDKNGMFEYFYDYYVYNFMFDTGLWCVRRYANESHGSIYPPQTVSSANDIRDTAEFQEIMDYFKERYLALMVFTSSGDQPYQPIFGFKD